MNRRWGASFSREMEWNGYMSFEETGSYIYIYRLGLHISGARTKLTNNACVTHLFVQISTSACNHEEGQDRNAAGQPAAVPMRAILQSLWLGIILLSPYSTSA